MYRKVDPHWQCCRSGDCCTIPSSIVMSAPERRLIEAYVEDHQIDRPLTFIGLAGGFFALKAAPCPLYDAEAAACTVYPVRPFNCRRFVCLRPDVKAEAFEADGSNMLDRVKQSRVARRIAEKFQRKAQRWARETRG